MWPQRGKLRHSREKIGRKGRKVGVVSGGEVDVMQRGIEKGKEDESGSNAFRG